MVIVKYKESCYAFRMNYECEDQIELYKYNLQEIPIESLNSLLNLVRSCTDCSGCQGQVEMLERMIAERAES